MRSQGTGTSDEVRGGTTWVWADIPNEFYSTEKDKKACAGEFSVEAEHTMPLPMHFGFPVRVSVCQQCTSGSRAMFYLLEE